MPQLAVLTILPPEVTSVCQLPAGFKAQPLGTRDEVMQVIRELYPNADFSDPILIKLPDQSGMNGAGAPTEIMLGEVPVLESLTIRRPTLTVLNKFYQRTGWKAVDPMSDIIPLG